MTVVDDIRDLFSSKAKKNKGSHNAFLGYIKDVGGGRFEYAHVGSAACHGPFGGMGRVSPNTEFLLSELRPLLGTKEIKEEVAPRFYHWLMNESVWAPLFVDKDYESVKERGFLISTDQPATFTLSGLVATRTFTERYNTDFLRRVGVYAELLKAGASFKEALLFMHYLGGENGKSPYPLKWSNLSSGHTIMNAGCQPLEYSKNFLEERYFVSPTTFKKNCGYMSGAHAMWIEDQRERYESSPFFNEVKKIRPRKVVKVRDYHIFRPAPKEVVAVSDLEGLKDVVTQLKELIYA